MHKQPPELPEPTHVQVWIFVSKNGVTQFQYCICGVEYVTIESHYVLQ